MLCFSCGAHILWPEYPFLLCTRPRLASCRARSAFPACSSSLTFCHLRLPGACSHLLPPLLCPQLISHCQRLPHLPFQRRLVFPRSRWAAASLWRAGRSGRRRNRTFCSMPGSQNGDSWTLLHWPVSALPVPIVFAFSGRASRLNLRLLWRVQSQEDLEGCCWPGTWPYPHLDEEWTCPISLASVSSGCMLPFWWRTRRKWHSFSAWNLLSGV